MAGVGRGAVGNNVGKQSRAFCSGAMLCLPSTMRMAARMSSSPKASWIDFTSRARICVDDSLLPLELREDGEAESSHSLPHSPPQARHMRLEMAVAVDSPFWPRCPPRLLMDENMRRSKKKKAFMYLTSSVVPAHLAAPCAIRSRKDARADRMG